jgi:TonB family protein
MRGRLFFLAVMLFTGGYAGSVFSQPEATHTILDVKVNKDGTVKSAAVTSSSGSARLDQAAIDYVRAHWKRVPKPNGEAAEADAIIKMDWQLKNAQPTNVVAQAQASTQTQMPYIPPPQPDTTPPLVPTANTLLDVWLNADGSIKTLSVDLPSGSSQRDQDAIALVKAQWKGTPGTGFARVNVHWILPPDQAPQSQISIAP